MIFFFNMVTSLCTDKNYIFIYLYRSIWFSIANLNRVLCKKKKTTIINYH